MLYGISLLAGLVNAVHLPTVAIRLSQQLPGMDSPELMVLVLALLMIGVGLAFKLSAVPFHFWCPDVFEGAPAEVGGFLSVASKAAALALLLRVTIGIGWISPEGELPGWRSAGNTSGVASRNDDNVARVAATESRPAEVENWQWVAVTASDESAGGNEQLADLRHFMAQMLALVAAITCTFGNLAAYGQTNIKRMLAYSTIAHAGYMIMAVPAVLELMGHSTPDAQNAAASLVIYLFVYLFLNLGAFAIVAFLRNRMQSEEISDYAGLLFTSPGVSICLSLIMFGLIGLPPLSGFIGKFAVFAALTDAFRASGHGYLMVIFLIAGINTAISLFYYLRVVRVMTMTSEPARYTMPLNSADGLYVLVLTIPTALLIVGWDRLGSVTMAAARSLFG
jgi:NADH-quinone oxidoreductase subunit N